MITTQGSIPEETTVGDAINERSKQLRTFQELGPQDLVSLIKEANGAKGQEVNNSSSSSVAAQLNQIAGIISSSPQTWFGKVKHFKVTKAIYASYDAFSKIDVIVVVNIPGAVQYRIQDQFGNEIVENDRIWLEVFASSIARALLGSEEDDEQVNSLVESRHLNPLTSVEVAKQFFDAFEVLFKDGPKLGAVSEVQSATLVTNYFVDAFLKAVELTNLYDYALDILHRLRKEHEIAISLIVKVLFLKNQEIKAIQYIHSGLKINPRDPYLLVLQSEFLVRRGELDLALESAIHAVNSSPSDFFAWVNLSKVYLESGNIEKSLLTLNASPMAAYKEKSHLKRIINVSTNDLHLPQPVDVKIDDVYDLDSKIVQKEHSDSDQALLNLQAANLKSTFASAYGILTDIVHRIGWENLLKIRAQIFVMEEEYRTKSSSESIHKQSNSEDQENSTTSFALDNSFRKKRLCERWLDNLFLILYDDLRIYTLWQGEIIQFEAQNTTYHKTSLEWEHLGMCSFRLHHYKEASIAFNLALAQRFAPTSTRNLLKYYQSEVESLVNKQQKLQNVAQNGSNGNTPAESSHQITRKINNLDEKIIECIIKLSAWNHRWYSEFAPYLLVALKKVVARQGLVKIESEIKVFYGDETGASDLLNYSFDFLRTFQVDGYDN
ncbi:hypothetical protein WICMUC_002486 [Wickerhamomyces mucosus]|uniref:Uncharacterized protein n=1 Tax=Wickerhamomyces mucosus TaxID=1378264 RepID=A0A9P8PQR8_9ASCO|nr:hypothetical protein WICMUC_002486 [Wickerhamomyces mucosus]